MAKPSDFVVDNASGSAVRTDLNNIFDAISINNGFSSGAPTTKYKYMWYADEASSGKMSFYKSNATDKIDFISLTDGSFFGPNGSTSNPSFTFSNSTSTGFYRSASNEIGVSNNGTNTSLFKTTGTEIKGKLEVIPTSGGASFDIKTNGLNNQDTSINLVADTTYTSFGCSLKRLQTANGESQLVHRGTGRLHIYCQDAGEIAFTTQSVVRWEINDNGGLYWQEHTGGGNAPISGDILPRGIISRRGTAANASVANPYNFYWDTNHLECWVDGAFTGDVSGPTSDYRIKKNVALQTESGIDKIKNLKPIIYQYKDYGVIKGSDVVREGFLAHELQEIIPSAVNREKDVENALQTLNLDAITAVLTKALQEAVAKIETLETKVAALEAG